MNRLFVLSFVVFLTTCPAHAQTWAEQQQIYNQNHNLKEQLFQQDQEIDDMRRKHEKLLKDQQRQIDQQRFELNKSYQNTPSVAPRSYILEEQDRKIENEKLLKDMERQRKAAETRAFVESEMPTTELKFNEDYINDMKNSLLEKGYDGGDVSRVEYAWKAMLLRREQAALKGDSKEQRLLAIDYLEGDAIKQDYNKAVKLFESAANAGDAEAQTYLGNLYFEGKITPKNDELAADWHMKAAQQGSINSQFALGAFYSEGIGGLAKDSDKSYEWYKKAADRGYGDAQYVLGLRYFYGNGVIKDDVEAAFWFMLAGINHSSFLENEHDRLVSVAPLMNLSSQQQKIVGARVVNWEPVRTASEQKSFENLVSSQERLIVSRLMYLNFSKEQASTILIAYKKHLFGSIGNRELKSEQMRKIFSTAEKQLANMQANSNRYEEAVVRVITELTK